MEILDWNIMKNGAEELIKKEIILYGTSSSAERMLYLLKNLNLQEKIICVCDTFKNKWGSVWNGFKVASPMEILDISNKNIVVVICSIYEIEIYKYLMEIGCIYDIVASKAYIHAVHGDLMNKKKQYFSREIVERYKEMYELWIQVKKGYREEKIQLMTNEFLELLLRKESCILIHSMQKTGNLTLEASLDEYPNVIRSQHLLCESKKEKNILSTIIKTIHPEIKIFTGIRYPIERIISRKWHYFELPWVNYDSYPDTEINGTTANLPEAMYSFSNVIKWFKEQIEELFGIDVFQHKFDIDKGYTIIRKDNISIFLYRLDYLDKLEKEIGDFIGNNCFKIIRKNEAKNKGYALAYQEYLRDVEIDSEFFELLISSKEMCHFFSKEECKKYRRKWLPYLK